MPAVLLDGGPLRVWNLSECQRKLGITAGGVPPTRQINTTGPLTGGGDLSADRTITLPQASAVQDGYLSAADFASFTADAIVEIGFVMDGGGAVLTTGTKGFINIPFDCTLTQVNLFADQVGSVVVDIWKDTYANFPPTLADTITAAAKPTLSAAQKYQDATLAGWTTTVTAGDVLAFNVDSAASIIRLTVTLKALRT